ncbi:hypothetical protein, partial [Aeromonas veronii]
MIPNKWLIRPVLVLKSVINSSNHQMVTSIKKDCSMIGDTGRERSESWLRGPDLNRRPSGYEPDELPSCST